MRLYYFAIGVAVVTLLCAFAGHAIAQSAPFSLAGQVIDASGNPISGAVVTLLDSNSAVLGVETTGNDGSYDFLNVVSNTSNVRMTVIFMNGGTAYTLPSNYTRWYPAQGIQVVPGNETQIFNYPSPAIGLVTGTIVSSDNQPIDGVAFLENVNTGITYYKFANNTAGNSSFLFIVPAGDYWLYARHYGNGAVYESTHQQINVVPSYTPEIVAPYIITIPDSPSTAPGAGINEPSPHVNVVTGTVLFADGYPAANVSVTLYEESDNGTVFFPTNYITTTDSNGDYTFSGVVPTSDGGGVLQSSKPIEARAQYYDSNGTPQSVYSSPETLYYPDVVLGNGQEDSARNIAMSTLTIPNSVWTTPQPSVTSEPTNNASTSSPGSAGTFIAIAAIGVICIACAYFLLYKKS
jgi:hypothetical protein